MFTGIIQALGSIKKIDHRGGDVRLTVETGRLDMTDVSEGDSIAVNGICLTVVDWDSHSFSADVSQETLAKTSLAQLKRSSAVNLEKALLATGRLGGHFVTGHVDGLGKLIAKKTEARSMVFSIQVPKSLQYYIATKGSVTIDGVSLTVNIITNDIFQINIIPQTMDKTIFQYYQLNQSVNIEIDVIARYLDRLQQATTDNKQGLSQLLQTQGFLKE